MDSSFSFSLVQTPFLLLKSLSSVLKKEYEWLSSVYSLYVDTEVHVFIFNTVIDSLKSKFLTYYFMSKRNFTRKFSVWVKRGSFLLHFFGKTIGSNYSTYSLSECCWNKKHPTQTRHSRLLLSCLYWNGLWKSSHKDTYLFVIEIPSKLNIFLP